MRELVRGYATACFETAEEAGRLDDLASDMVGFTRALGLFPALRGALGDVDVPVPARRAVVSELLVDKATPEGTALVAFAVASERPADLPSSLAALAELAEERAASRSRDRALVSEPLTAERATVRSRIAGYTERVLEELGGSGEIDEVEDELFAIARLLATQGELRRILADATTALAARASVLDDLIGGRVHPATLRLARYVLGAGRLRDLVGVFQWLVDVAAAERGRRVAEVRSAVALEPAETERLAGALGRLVNREVEVRVIEDPSVIGGLFISVGDLLIDGTLELRLERLRDVLRQTG